MVYPRTSKLVNRCFSTFPSLTNKLYCNILLSNQDSCWQLVAVSGIIPTGDTLILCINGLPSNFPITHYSHNFSIMISATETFYLCYMVSVKTSQLHCFQRFQVTIIIYHNPYRIIFSLYGMPLGQGVL